tara:strand:- start:465 stop:704 length:240 start_codon:yes stop_codon:yes gene_type:complete
MAKIYSLSIIEQYIQNYFMYEGAEWHQIEEGCLGLGNLMLTAKDKKTIIIKEVYLNSQSSGHTLRKYNKIPKKYVQYLN